jgi:antirestriction protein ArdC
MSAPLNASNRRGFREEKIVFEGEYNAKHHRKKRRLQPHHRADRRVSGKGVRPWVRPWNAEHAAGRITRPLRHNGQPYSGINILSLWMSALGQNFAAPIWMTFRQASELNAHVRKGEKGSLVVYANAITRTEHDEKPARMSSAKSRT